MSCCCTLATATETVRGPAACAFCCLESPPEQPEKNAQTTPRVTAKRIPSPEWRADCGRSSRKLESRELESVIFTVSAGCAFPQARRRTHVLLDVFIFDSVAVSPQEKGSKTAY